MSSQWDNFLCNLGEWHGTFASLDSQQREYSCTSSILTLEQGDERRLVRFGVQRWSDPTLQGSATDRGEPLTALRQDYRSLGKQVVFFPCGTFSKGSMQLAPGTAFGAEFGFIDGDRRHRLVVLYDQAGCFDRSVLIREYRAGSVAVEQPPLEGTQLTGFWTGEEHTISADWAEVSTAPVQLSLDVCDLVGMRWLADGGGFRVPTQVSHREAFEISAFWCPDPNRAQRLVRRYDSTGAWLSASQALLTRS